MDIQNFISKYFEELQHFIKNELADIFVSLSRTAETKLEIEKYLQELLYFIQKVLELKLAEINQALNNNQDELASAEIKNFLDEILDEISDSTNKKSATVTVADF